MTEFRSSLERTLFVDLYSNSNPTNKVNKLTDKWLNWFLTLLCASHINSSSQGLNRAIVVTFVQSYFFHTFGFVENMRNSFPGGLAIGSHKDWSSQGHLPFTVAEKLPQNRRTSDKNLPGMTKEALTEGTNSRSEREFGTWKRGNQVSCHVFIMWFGKEKRLLKN